MGYDHYIVTANCGKCNARRLWNLTTRRSPIRGKCQCGAINTFDELPEWPDIPRTLYIGPEKYKRLKLFPIPPSIDHFSSWALPYSIRSFVYQSSRELGGCRYDTHYKGEVMGEMVYSDECTPPYSPEDENPPSLSCHMVAGWTTGETSCALWENVSKLCQTKTEVEFLHWYLALAKDRHFPMLIPQVRIGIAERRRPDFIIFVPLQYWKFKRYAVQLDAAHPNESASEDLERDEDVKKHGYEVLSLRPVTHGYLQEVKWLVEKVDEEMRLAEFDPWSVAIEVSVVHTVGGPPPIPDDDVLF